MGRPPVKIVPFSIFAFGLSACIACFIILPVLGKIIPIINTPAPVRIPITISLIMGYVYGYINGAKKPKDKQKINYNIPHA